MLSRVVFTSIAPIVGGVSSLSSRSHGVVIRERTFKRRQWSIDNHNLGFVNSKVLENLGFRVSGGVASGKGSLTCWCQRISEEENAETDVPEAGVESTAQVEAFCTLPSTVPWGTGEVASTMLIFWTIFHIPLGLGGLDIVAKVLPEQTFMDPQTQAISVVLVQLLELAGTVWLIRSTLQPFGPLPECFNFRFTEVWKNRGWLPASTMGLLVLLAVAASASLTHDVSPSEVSNGSSGLTSLLRSTPLARVAIYVAYCGVTPCLEEYVYRGFLLSSLRTYMRWPLAVVVSALLFSISHLSPPGFLSLFWVGCCLGTAYAWNGNLATSFVMHSLYNAIVLTKALLS